MLCFVNIIQARIGETPEEAEKRYGAPVKKETLRGLPCYLYQKSGFTLGFVFYNGKAAQMYVRKSEKDQLDRPLEISDLELNLILKTNSGGKEWEKFPAVGDNEKNWMFEEKQAKYYTVKRELVIMTEDYIQFVKKKTEEKEKENLEGF